MTTSDNDHTENNRTDRGLILDAAESARADKKKRAKSHPMEYFLANLRYRPAHGSSHHHGSDE